MPPARRSSRRGIATESEPLQQEALKEEEQDDKVIEKEEVVEKEEEADAVADTDSDADADADVPKPEPKFVVFQKVLAKDTTTPLLYEAVVRKFVFAPKSKKVNICLLESPEESLDEDGLDAIMGAEPVYSWHYFVHYQGWNVKWDRWVGEDQLYADTDAARVLAKRLKEESKCLKKGASQKKVIETMQRIVRLEQDLREKLARGESIEFDDRIRAEETLKTENLKKKPDTKSSLNGKEGVTLAFISREIGLRRKDLSSRKCSISLPFSLKKILTDDWEIITQCGMLHSLPAPVSVMDALNAYYEFKMKVLLPSEEKEEEKKENEMNLDPSNESDETFDDENNHHEWKEMVDGIALFFDQALPKRLIFRHEIPQCLLLEQNHEKRYCELYPCEYLIRMCIKLPDLLDDAKHIPDEEKSKILFKIGDLLRFLNRHHDLYFLQRFRKATVEEVAKAQRLKKKLGLEEEIKEDEVTTEATCVEETTDLVSTSKKNRKAQNKGSKGRKGNDDVEDIGTEEPGQSETALKKKRKAQSKNGNGKKSDQITENTQSKKARNNQSKGSKAKQIDVAEAIGTDETTEPEIASKKRKSQSKVGTAKKMYAVTETGVMEVICKFETGNKKSKTTRSKGGNTKAIDVSAETIGTDESAEPEMASKKRMIQSKVGKGKKGRR